MSPLTSQTSDPAAPPETAPAKWSWTGKQVAMLPDPAQGTLRRGHRPDPSSPQTISLAGYALPSLAGYRTLFAIRAGSAVLAAVLAAVIVHSSAIADAAIPE